MKKIIFILSFIFLSFPTLALAQNKGAQELCDLSLPNGGCGTNLVCQRTTADTPATKKDEYRCYSLPSNPNAADVFGKIVPPKSIVGFGFGEAGLGNFLSNLILLIYSIAAIVLIFMILWGAFDWITSEGDKEKLEKARNKIINAIVGILIFAAAFGIISILGQFTGFKFFKGQP